MSTILPGIRIDPPHFYAPRDTFIADTITIPIATDQYTHEDELRDARDDRPQLLVMEENRTARLGMREPTRRSAVRALAESFADAMRTVLVCEIDGIDCEPLPPRQFESLASRFEGDDLMVEVNRPTKPRSHNKRKGKGRHKNKPWDHSSGFR